MDDLTDKNEEFPAQQDDESAEANENTPAEEQTNGEAEDKSGISADLIRGHINTIILRALYERDKYGYEIINDIERKSHNQYTLKQPTLYSALKRLENQGYILAYWKTDEVTSGGRRKYFTLTDSGREITEKNLAEWEYSRTIIDSLISDRSFDFSQPAPTPVDFTILRNSVSRVPVIKNGEEQEDAEKQGEVNFNTQKADESQRAEQYAPAQPVAAEQAPAPAQQVEQPAAQQPSAVQAATPAQETEADIEARRRAHENYLKLISSPVPDKQPSEDVVPNSSNVRTAKLLYNVKPETERDYKNLINGIYDRAIANGRVETSYTRSDARASQRKQEAATSEILDRGRNDGVRISPSYEYDSRSNYATKTTYNKGLTLTMSSAAVLFVLLVEFMFCMIFRSKLGVPLIYPITLLLIGIVQFAIFGGLFLKGYGANCAKPLSNSYISKCIVITILLILIICVSSFLFRINFSLASDVMKLIVLPSITVMNITLFAVCFYLFSK